MFQYLFRWRQRRFLRPIVSILPDLLTKAYGPADHYSPQQIGRALEKIRARPELRPYAFSAYCKTADIIPDLKLVEQQRLAHRAEIADLFDIARHDYTAEDIRKLNKPLNWTSAKWWHSDWSYYQDHGNGPGHSQF